MILVKIGYIYHSLEESKIKNIRGIEK